jgi:hypothetical protein
MPSATRNLHAVNFRKISVAIARPEPDVKAEIGTIVVAKVVTATAVAAAAEIGSFAVPLSGMVATATVAAEAAGTGIRVAITGRTEAVRTVPKWSKHPGLQ